VWGELTAGIGKIPQELEEIGGDWADVWYGYDVGNEQMLF